ncbi:unnamed protein product, partial [Cyprideis torosa]
MRSIQEDECRDVFNDQETSKGQGKRSVHRCSRQEKVEEDEVDEDHHRCYPQGKIQKFRKSAKITLLGHSAGAASAMHHFLSGRSTRLFSRMILMSGTALAPWALSKQPRDFAMDLGRRLSCQTETSVSLLRCLRERDANEILVAFGRQKMASSDLPANGAMYGPVVDKFLPPAQQMVPEDPHESLMKATVPRIPVIIGGTGDEGVIALYYYNGIPQGTFAEIKAFFVNSAIPQMLRQYGFVDQLPAAADRGSSNVLVLRELLEYLYVQRVAQGDKAGLLRMLVKVRGRATAHA